MPLASGLRGQGALITGASQGIGFGAARAFLEEGARVVMSSSSQEHLGRAAHELAAFGEVTPVVADLRRQEDLDRLVISADESLNGIDTFVYVTGSPAPGVFMEQDYANWSRAAELLLVSPAYLARRVVETMIRRKKAGRLVFLASVAIREPIANIATSNVARISIAGLVRTLAREVGPHQIRVNGILPGLIGTGRIDEVFRDTAQREKITPEAVRTRTEAEIPLRRVGTPEELARTIVFLGSDLSAYVSGAMIPVDGGSLRSVG